METLFHVVSTSQVAAFCLIGNLEDSEEDAKAQNYYKSQQHREIDSFNQKSNESKDSSDRGETEKTPKSNCSHKDSPVRVEYWSPIWELTQALNSFFIYIRTS